MSSEVVRHPHPADELLLRALSQDKDCGDTTHRDVQLERMADALVALAERQVRIRLRFIVPIFLMVAWVATLCTLSFFRIA